MRAVDEGAAPIAGEFVSMMEECVQCRGCEPVCPAFVPFGRLMEGARQAVHEDPGARRTWWRRGLEAVAYRVVLPRHWVLRLVGVVAWLARRVGLWPRRLGVPRTDLRSIFTPLRPSPGSGEQAGRGEVILFPGCVMDVWMRDVHRAAIRVVERTGGSVSLPDAGADCCGALHLHAGRRAEAERLAGRTMQALPGDAPIVVDSAGCAAAMKDYGHWLGTPEAERFSRRVREIHEWLAERELPEGAPSPPPVVVQDPCHLRHVQHGEGAVRAVLGRFYRLEETDDSGLCCGAGGAYALLQPRLANDIRERKTAALRRAGGDAPLVASANPGCILHLRAAGLDVRHPVELLDAAWSDRRRRLPG